MSQQIANTPAAWILPEHLRRRLEKHPLGKNLFITAIGLYSEQLPQSFSEPTGVAAYTLLYVAHGKGWLETAQQKSAFKANQYLLIPGYTAFHAWPSAEAPWRMYAVQFSGLLAADIYNYLGTALKPHTIPPLVGRNAQFDDILHHLDLMNNIENLLYANFRFYSFLGTFRLTVFNYMKKGAENIIEQCIQIMKQKLDQHLTLADLSQATCLSASYLSAIFKEKTKYSPIQLFTSLRMQKASQLLKSTRLSVKEIAGEMGYPDQYSFSRSFKSVMGLSPKTFREKLEQPGKMK
ncbi:AraC-type DNA-binding protein [Chitinophaga terrae (ex Kim and Jung 2007)]|jgi:AraC-like DNA-binding protein|uniref:AraC-type DNA-binding protein n=1 Tax=Chitinophaga terrae (ex Kim and Jung 2007) TaxID=408074 RepID=A0A1H4ASE2_9BACT|nr:AraC family transcriptional regulator [Chitinophaga terrae (ex Kim and Jung 2007)]MDQ0106737.1 AraC-like DNA-binding protein [Chitinophaga terrae (ex Kim and Jung 2007)]GEP89165.1 AraC family transcriptional regulator [Chitinophaga terrae (ex Kim and Jung 2007)]SEA38800.1 AraC-type DNA-binding protein [Chitinophaga terrae (ex Kim and Jung 2007)]